MSVKYSAPVRALKTVGRFFIVLFLFIPCSPVYLIKWAAFLYSWTYPLVLAFGVNYMYQRFGGGILTGFSALAAVGLFCTSAYSNYCPLAHWKCWATRIMERAVWKMRRGY